MNKAISNVVVKQNVRFGAFVWSESEQEFVLQEEQVIECEDNVAANKMLIELLYAESELGRVYCYDRATASFIWIHDEMMRSYQIDEQ